MFYGQTVSKKIRMKNWNNKFKIILFSLLIIIQDLIIMELRNKQNDLSILNYWLMVIFSGVVSAIIILFFSFGTLRLKEIFINNLSFTKNESYSIVFLINGILIILYLVYVLSNK